MLENQKANLVLDHRLLRVWFYALIYLSTYLSKISEVPNWALCMIWYGQCIFYVENFYCANCLKNRGKSLDICHQIWKPYTIFSLFGSCFFSPSPSTWKGPRNWTRTTKRATECFLSWCKLLFVCCLCCCGVYCICSA